MRLFNKLKKKSQSLTTDALLASADLSKKLSTSLYDNLAYLLSVYEDCGDIAFHSFDTVNSTHAVVIYAQGLADEALLEHHVLAPLMFSEESHALYDSHLLAKSPSASEQVHDWSMIIENIGSGHPVLLIDGENTAFVYSMTKVSQRNVEEPVAESTIRGARDGFTESLAVNIPLIRRRIKSPEFLYYSIC
ncbi:spore germination protein [Paenibacillus periandrae]|uniref:spore germination protein n=1 Tax=Paenibacillus periandrae TaxID=1761741 RepID=UPI001F093AC2|nr:spore germination protein [Paenibacillus periandrae]